MMSRNSNKTKKGSPREKSHFREYSESFLIAIGIALVIRVLVIYPFRIPTGSMENSLLVGDFLLANKFVYGIRTPDWVGIPYTKLGFSIPFFRTPGFRTPQRGDVVIFKYPQDASLNYIKRCVAMSGDTINISNKALYINSEGFPDGPHSKFIYPTYDPDYQESAIFPKGSGNRDFYGPVRVPAPGDTIRFTDANREKWFEWFQLAVYEGRKVTISHEGETERLTVK